MNNLSQPAAGGVVVASITSAVGNVLRWGLVPVLAVGAIPALDLATGGHGSATVMAALADPLAVMAARSPGGRPAGALTQSKPLKPARERVLAEALTRPPRPTDAPGGGAGATPVEEPLPATPIIDTTPEPGAGIGDVASGAVGSGFYPGGGIAITPDVSIVPGLSGGGGDGGGGGGETPSTPITTTPTTPATPTASVPEPSTWLSMMLGFGAVGGALRLRRRKVTAVRPA